MEKNNTYWLEKDGDELEKRFYPRLSALFPNYEQFWQTVIVPATMREIDGNLGLRPGVAKDFELLAMSHYSCYCHLGIAHEMLEMAGARPYLYDDYFFHLDAAVEMARNRFLRYCEKVWEEVGLAEYRVRFETKLGSDWQDKKSEFEQLARDVTRYRNAFTHDPRIGRIIERDNRFWIPRYELLDPDKSITWSDIPTFSYPRDFVCLEDLVLRLMKEVSTSMNALWPEIISMFDSLSNLDAYQQLARIGPYSPKVARPEIVINNLAPSTHSATISGGAQSIGNLPYTSASGTFPPPNLLSVD